MVSQLNMSAWYFVLLKKAEGTICSVWLTNPLVHELASSRTCQFANCQRLVRKLFAQFTNCLPSSRAGEKLANRPFLANSTHVSSEMLV